MAKRWWLGRVLVASLALLVVATVAALTLGYRPWEPSLTDQNPVVRAAAVRILSHRGDIRLLIQALDDADPDVRLLAIQGLECRNASATEIATALVHKLKDEHAGVRREAAWSLSSICPEACPALRDALHDEDPRLRGGAALALAFTYAWKGRSYCPSLESQPILTKMLDDTDPEVRRNAQRALERILPKKPRDDAP